MNLPILNKFTEHLKQALKNSFRLALDLKQKELVPLHLLYGLILEKGSVAEEILKKEDITKDKVVSLILNLQRETKEFGLPLLSKKTEKILERGAIIALEKTHRYIGTEHLLLAIVESDDAEIKKIFDNRKQSIKKTEEELNNVLASVNHFPEISSLASAMAGEMSFIPAPMPTGTVDAKIKKRKNPALDFFTTDLTSSKELKKMDTIIGREKETERLIQILCRRQKNNPALLGDPGVGKTAIVEGLAQKISMGEVPEELLGKKILRLDLGLLIAGTIYRGEFESRLKQLVEEIRNDPAIIIFIDEMHTLVGAGSSSGSLDASNILKPALARGELHCIGATTFDEFKKHIESDPALERRFQAIVVNEPTKAETEIILKGIAKKYEIFHGLNISAEAIKAATDFSDRYFPEKFFPDKAIDLLDEASSAKKLKFVASRERKELNGLQNKLEEIREQKQENIIQEKFDEAAKLKKIEEEILKKMVQLKKMSGEKTKRKKETLFAYDVAGVITQTTGIPLSTILNQEQNVEELEKRLKEKIIGQDEIIEKIVQTLLKAKIGLNDPQRPLASFLFVGPTGVGKTELAKVLAETYFPTETQKSNFVKIDMSEFGESFQATKLIGAPAGYVGYKEGNTLSDKIKNRPYSVILFDEIDKAHPDIFNLFLQILDEGILTDATGKKVNFKNTIIIMTANLGEDVFKKGAIGFDESKEQKNFVDAEKDLLEEIKKKFRLDFLNRIDKLLIFHPLNISNFEKIAALEIEKIAKRIQEKGYTVKSSKEVNHFLAKTAAKTDQGARGIKKLISEQIEPLLAKAFLQKKFDVRLKFFPKEQKINLE